MEISDEGSEQGRRESTSHEPNSAHTTVLLRTRAMYMQELAVPPEFLQQMSAWATHTQQAQQNSAMLIQELYRGTQVLGDTVQQVPMTLCNRLRESLGDVLKKHELNLIEVKDRLSTRFGVKTSIQGCASWKAKIQIKRGVWHMLWIWHRPSFER